MKAEGWGIPDEELVRREVIGHAQLRARVNVFNLILDEFKSLFGIRSNSDFDPECDIPYQEAHRVNALVDDMRMRGVSGSCTALSSEVLKSNEFNFWSYVQLYFQTLLTSQYPKILASLRKGDFDAAHNIVMRAARRQGSKAWAHEAFRGVVADEVDTLARTQNTPTLNKLLQSSEKLISRAGAGMFVTLYNQLKDDVERSNFLVMLAAKCEGEFKSGTPLAVIETFVREFNDGTGNSVQFFTP